MKDRNKIVAEFSEWNRSKKVKEVAKQVGEDVYQNEVQWCLV